MEESESKYRENSREVLRVRKEKGGRGILAGNWARDSLNSNYGVSRENRSKCTDSRHI